MLNAYIYDGLRTPIGRHAGKLATIRPDDFSVGSSFRTDNVNTGFGWSGLWNERPQVPARVPARSS